MNADCNHATEAVSFIGPYHIPKKDKFFLHPIFFEPAPNTILKFRKNSLYWKWKFKIEKNTFKSFLYFENKNPETKIRSPF